MATRHSGIDAVQFAIASIATKIRERRKDAGLSQGMVARKAKIRQETLSRIEHGLGNPTVDIIGRIAWAIEQLDKRNTSPRTLREIQTVSTRKTIIQVELNNTDMNALEDILYCRLNPRDRKLAEEKVRRLWKALVTAWDEPIKTSQQPTGKRPRAPVGS